MGLNNTESNAEDIHTEQSSPRTREFLINALHILTLSAFALAQPVFSLLSENATFFIAHNSTPIEIVSLVIVLFILVPGVLILTESLTGLLGIRYRNGIHYLFITGLITIALLPAMKKLSGIPGPALVLLVLTAGTGFCLLYNKHKRLRSYITALTPLTLIFPGFFLFGSPVSRIVFPEIPPVLSQEKTRPETPIVMVVFDEFPVTSLLDETMQIDPVLYPNFSALAEDSIWFRNATTVGVSTDIALPAILTGVYPNPELLPSFHDYPRNLFTLVGGAYDINVMEYVTNLCPNELSGVTATSRYSDRMFVLLYDTYIVYRNIITPDDLSGRLPEIIGKWKNFRHIETEPINGHELFRQFTESIKADRQPSTNFMHIFLPHRPYVYLPSGRKYTSVSKKFIERWPDDQLLVTKAYQRFLLQVEFVDTLIGELVGKLKNEGLYDRSLIVILSDHGISFRPDDYSRKISETNFQDIISIPLFIKMPYKKNGIIDDRNVETVDILPTIAEILKISIPWKVDGQSMIDPDLPGRKKKVVFSENSGKPLVFRDSIEEEKVESVRNRISLFGSGHNPDELYKIGPNSSLIGSNTDEISISSDIAGEVVLNQASVYNNIDPDSAFVPAEVSGSIIRNDGGNSPLDLAISLNGTIRAVTRTTGGSSNKAFFSALVPESGFQKHKNTVNVFIVERNNDSLILLQTVKQEEQFFLLSSDNKGKSLISSDGDSFRVISGGLEGHLEYIRIHDGLIELSGWAADIKNSETPDKVLVFVNDTFLRSVPINIERHDVAWLLGNDSLQKVGVKYTLYSTGIEENETTDIRVFAISKRGFASELR